MDGAREAILGALARTGAAVVLAPPGAGKTTRVPPMLLAAGLLGRDQCVVLEPRRVAARAAARRVAEELGGPVGGAVGYQVRFDRVASAATRILYVTEGILTARLQADPFLDGVAAVVLDEFHERSLEADLALAFLREVRQGARPDLHVVVMSATLDPGPVAAYLGAEVVEVAGRAHPVAVTYLDRPDPAPLAERARAGVQQAWARRPGGAGDLLCFLPGAGEIRAVARALEPWARDLGVGLVPLHGDLPGPAQDQALRRGAKPRVVLATNVAESSVTAEGVTAVVDTGVARVLRHDPGLGLDRLELEAVSRASADQRAGRAGREGPGVALRLWTRHDEVGRPARLEPEVLRADLSHAVLEVLGWGADPRAFPWLEPPPPGRLDAALDLLARLGAVNRAGRLTPEGEALRRLPLPPRLGRLVLEAARAGLARPGARLAALAAERDLLMTGRAFGPAGEVPTGPSDLLHRLELLNEAARARFDPGRLRALGVD
ncbi:MAG: DEAD/DEAH box helicase, partial [Deferrisomatales bacterium]